MFKKLFLSFLVAVLVLAGPSVQAATFLAADTNRNAIQALSYGTVYAITVTSSSAAQATAFGAGVVVARVVCNNGCRILCNAASPTALSTSTYLPPGVVEFPRVTTGNKCAFISTGVDGFATVTEME